MSTLAQKYLIFNSQVETMAAYLTEENRARLHIPDELYNRFMDYRAQWSQAYAKYAKPDRGSPAVLEISLIYKEFLSFIRRFRRWLKSGDGLIYNLTGDDYEELFIHRDKPTRTRSLPPEHAPSIVVLRTAHLEVEFEVRQPDSEHIHHLALPTGLKLSRTLALTGPLDPPPADEHYRPIDHATRSRFTLTFNPADADKIGYIICTFFNRLGKHGPPSPPLRFHII